MRIILTALLSIVILAPHGANAVTCPAKELGEAECNKVAGCGWDGTTCSECATGHYSAENQKCQKCVSSHPNSAKGSTNEDQCYKTCDEKTEDITGGKKNFTSTNIYKGAANQNCPFTITCNNTTDKCSGYHKNDAGTGCVLNYTTCTPDTGANGYSGIKYWNGTDWETTCYVKSCKSGYIQTNVHQCSTESVHISISCELNECQNRLSNCTNGTISNTWNWIWNTNTYTKDFSRCECNIIQTIDHGEGTSHGKYVSGEGGSTKWSFTGTVNKCDANYCEKDDAPGSCSKVPAGRYSGANDTQCHKCPMGATSTEGDAANIEKCYVTSSTKFCDGPTDADCFNLSITKQYYKQN